MRISIVILALFILTVYCNRDLDGPPDLSENIEFYTDKETYFLTQDSIKVCLENKTASDIEIGLRCNAFLEMEYQKYENDVWSDAISYLFILCPTFQDTLKTGDTYSEKLITDIFNSKGTYRFLLNIYIPKGDSTKYIYSNSFKLE